MDINDLHPPDDYSHRFFIWHEWIQAHHELTADNVFDYFATSMFYDKQSNNQVLRMQTMHTGVPVKDEAAELRRFTGIEFAVVHAQPPTFFIIQKRERLSPDEVRPLAAYFIMNNRIYQSPDLYTVISNRLLTSVTALQTSLDILRKHRPDYTPRTGFTWPISDHQHTSTVTDGKIQKTRESEAAAPASSSLSGQSQTVVDRGGGGGAPPDSSTSSHSRRRQQNTMLLMNAMKTTAAHSSKMNLMSFTQQQQQQQQQTVTGATSQIQNLNSPKEVVMEQQQVDSGTPIAASTMRSSATPETTTTTTTMQEAAKGPTTGGKKRKKRASLAPPPQVPP